MEIYYDYQLRVRKFILSNKGLVKIDKSFV